MKKELEQLRGELILPYTLEEFERYRQCYRFKNLRRCRCTENGEKNRVGNFFKVYYEENPPPIKRLPLNLKSLLKSAVNGTYVEVPKQYAKQAAIYIRQSRFAYKYTSKAEGMVKFLIQNEKK